MSETILSASAKASLKYERALSVSELASLGGRTLFRLSNGRGIFLVQRDSGGTSIAAMDHMCYHHGGPMIDGDIEDIRGVQCITCPWHKYRIAAETGECLYIGIDIATKEQQLKSKGKKQRVHFVKVEDGSIFVADSSAIDASSENSAAIGKSFIESDAYAFSPFNAGAKEVKAGGGGGGSNSASALPLHSSMK